MPLRTLVIQAVVTVALIVGFGVTSNSGFEKACGVHWPRVFLFLLLVGVAVIVLRLCAIQIENG